MSGFTALHINFSSQTANKNNVEIIGGRVLILIRFTAERISSCRLNRCLPFEVIRSLGPWYSYPKAPWPSELPPHTSHISILYKAAPSLSSLNPDLRGWPRVGGADACFAAWFRVENLEVLLSAFQMKPQNCWRTTWPIFTNKHQRTHHSKERSPAWKTFV